MDRRGVWIGLLLMTQGCLSLSDDGTRPDSGASAVETGVVDDRGGVDAPDSGSALDAPDGAPPIDVVDAGMRADTPDAGASLDVPDAGVLVDVPEVGVSDAPDVGVLVDVPDVGVLVDVSDVPPTGPTDTGPTDTGPTLRSLTVVLDGTGVGSITSIPTAVTCPGTCEASFVEGSTVTLRATADASNEFMGWTGCDTTTTGGSCIVMLRAARHVIATFNRRDPCLDGHGNISGYDCVPAAPSGWVGPVAFWDDPGTAPHACNALFPTAQPLGYSVLSAPPATCSACTCGSPSGGSCVEEVIGQSTCSAGSGGVPLPNLVGGACSTFLGTGHPADRYVSYRLDFPRGVSCPAGVQSPTLPRAGFGRTGTACRVASPHPSTGCSSGNVCSPVPPLGDSSAYRLCIYQVGDLACPSTYSSRTMMYSGMSDTRSCSACSCYNPGGSCSGTLRFYSDGACGSEISNVPISSARGELRCTGLSTGFLSARANWVGPTGTSCVPAVSRPTGTVTPTGPTTICCR